MRRSLGGLRRYLKALFKEVTKETDLVEWWSVCHAAPLDVFCYSMLLTVELGHSIV